MEANVHQALQAEFSKPTPDFAKIGKLLQTAIYQLTLAGLLAAPKATLQPQQLAVIRDVLEMGAYWSVHTRDGASFERYLSQLSSLYALPATVLQPSPRMYTLLGLRLLNLLVTKRTAEYHTSLARLGGEGRSAPHVQFVVQLEQCLMEGTFHRLLVARGQVPTPEYAWFVDSLLETVRMELASGMEKSFSSLDVHTAAALLLLDANQAPQVLEFAQKCGWQVQGSRIVFSTKAKADEATTEPQKMIQRALCYAAELEQIV